tara:strand:+ start:1286 stop:1438 length:153 start_codon:yes stop_codon:yes gene_type:complete
MSSSTFFLIASVGIPTLVFVCFMLIQYSDRQKDIENFKQKQLTKSFKRGK